MTVKPTVLVTRATKKVENSKRSEGSKYCQLSNLNLVIVEKPETKTRSSRREVSQKDIVVLPKPVSKSPKKGVVEQLVIVPIIQPVVGLKRGRPRKVQQTQIEIVQQKQSGSSVQRDSRQPRSCSRSKETRIDLPSPEPVKTKRQRVQQQVVAQPASPDKKTRKPAKSPAVIEQPTIKSRSVGPKAKLPISPPQPLKQQAKAPASRLRANTPKKNDSPIVKTEDVPCQRLGQRKPFQVL